MKDSQKGIEARLYVSVMNELYVKAISVQFAIILVYCACRFIVYLIFHNELQENLNEMVISAKGVSLELQRLNLIAQHQDMIDNLHMYGLVLNSSAQSSTPSSMATISKIDQMTDGIGFSVDNNPDLVYANLSVAKQSAVDNLSSILTASVTHIQTAEGSKWIKAVALTAQVEGVYLTVLKTMVGSATDTRDLYKYSSSCYYNKACQIDCMTKSKYSYECLSANQGPMLSPLRLFNDSSLNSRTYVYSMNGPNSYRISFFYTMESKPEEKVLISSGGRAALCTGFYLKSGEETFSINSVALRRKSQTSSYRLEPELNNYQPFLEKTFKVINPRKIELLQNQQSISDHSTPLVTLWGNWILSSIIVLREAFLFADVRSLISLQSQDAIQFVIILGIFSFNISFLHW